MTMLHLPGIKKVRAKGRPYYYHRATGKRIKAEPGTPEFIKQYSELNAPPRENPAPQPDTFGGLRRAYVESSDFTDDLSERTRSDYHDVMDYLCDLDAMPLKQWDSPFVKKLIERTYKKRGRRFANYVLTVVRVMFRWGVPWGITQSDPTQYIKPKKRPRDAPIANRAWLDEEIDVVLAVAPTWLLVAIAISLFTALRESDVLTVPWTKYKRGTFVTRAKKNNAPIEIPAHPILQDILDGIPRLAKTIVTGARGRELTQSGFQCMFRRFIKGLQAAGLVGDGLTFHGLRHTMGKMLAEAGCTVEQIMDVLGVTRAMAEHYSKEANRAPRSRAAIQRLTRRSAGKWKTGRARVENQFARAGSIGG